MIAAAVHTCPGCLKLATGRCPGGEQPCLDFLAAAGHVADCDLDGCPTAPAVVVPRHCREQRIARAWSPSEMLIARSARGCGPDPAEFLSLQECDT